MMSTASFASAAPPPSAVDDFNTQAGNPDFVLSLARGLRVIESFEGHYEGRSISEISQSTGLSRASIRRLLLTLELLGCVERSRQVYKLKTQVLRLGFSYLSSSSVVEAARPVLEHITEQLHESCSMSMLDSGQIVYVARSAASRVLAAGLSVGSRPPIARRWGASCSPRFPRRNSPHICAISSRAPTRPKLSLAFRKSKRPFSRCKPTATQLWTRNSKPAFDRLLFPFQPAIIASWRPSTSAPTFRASTAKHS
jgi:predicted transcriptional regulator